MPVLEYSETRVTRQNILNTQNPWRYCRRVDLSSQSLNDVTEPELSRWLERAGPYVESIDAGNFFSTTDRISLFWSQCSQTPCLRKLNVRAPFPSERQNADLNVLGDVLLLALSHVSSTLQSLTLSRVSFSSPVTVERFFAGSKALSYLRLTDIKALGQEKAKVEAVGRAFRRGIERNQMLREVHLSFQNGEKNEILFLEILQGVLKNKHVKDLDIHIMFGYTSSSVHTLTATRILLAGLSAIRNLDFSGDIALIALFQGLASCAVSFNELCIAPLSRGSTVDFNNPSTDSRLADAIREWNGGSPTNNNPTGIIKTLWLGGETLGPQAGAALADRIAQMMVDGTVENLFIQGVIPTTLLDPILCRLCQLRTVILSDFTDIFDRTDLNNYVARNQHACKLTELTLNDTSLSEGELLTLLRFLSRLKSLKKVCIRNCDITAEHAVQFAGFIQQTNTLKELDLTGNPVETQGARTIFEAIRSGAARIERLALDTASGFNDEYQFCINACGEALGNLLTDSHLVDLQLSTSIEMERVTVEILANGLRQNTSLKKLGLPYIKIEDLALLGGSLVENRVLELLETGRDENLEYSDEANEEEEQALCSFIDLLPQMARLKKLASFFDRKPTKRLIERAIAAMRANTVLEEVLFVGMTSLSNVFANEEVQYYLELNRLHRRRYLASIGDKTLPSSLLPHILAKKTRPEFSGHLFYFLRNGASLMQPPATNASSFLKRKAASSPDSTE